MQLFQQLDKDWQRLVSDGDARQATARWRRTCPPLGDVLCLAELVRDIRTAETPDISDGLLSALAAMAATDELAARTILQALVPGLSALTNALATLDDRNEIESAVVASAWIRIRTYPHDRRPRQIAANVLLDVRKEVVRSHQRPNDERLESLAASSQPVTSNEFELPSLLDEGLAFGLLTERDVQIIRATRIQERTLIDESASLGVGVDALRKRRARAEKRLKQFARASLNSADS
jgi:hypothetical protein